MTKTTLRCIIYSKAVEAGSQDEVQQRETLSDLAILGGLAHDAQTIRDIISEEIVQESSIIQYFSEKSFEQGIERGIERGKKQYAIEAILTVLDIHFQNGIAEKLRSFLEVIDDLERLDHLHRVAAQASDIDEFTDALLNLKN